jgi:hypothetical protein
LKSLSAEFLPKLRISRFGFAEQFLLLPISCLHLAKTLLGIVDLLLRKDALTLFGQERCEDEVVDRSWSAFDEEVYRLSHGADLEEDGLNSGEQGSVELHIEIPNDDHGCDEQKICKPNESDEADSVGVDGELVGDLDVLRDELKGDVEGGSVLREENIWRSRASGSIRPNGLHTLLAGEVRRVEGERLARALDGVACLI